MPSQPCSSTASPSGSFLLGHTNFTYKQGSTCLRSLRSKRQQSCSVYCRRTVSGGKDKKRRSSQQKPKTTQTNVVKTAGPAATRKVKTESQLQQFIRSTPVLNRFTDGTLLLGDIVMVIATEVSSGRIRYEDMPLLAGVSVVCWCVAGASLGDYKGVPPHSDNWYISLLGPAFLAIIDSTLTWALSVTLALAVFSVLVSSNMMDSGPLFDDLGTEDLSPQLEVAVATLITMSCWRGIAARLRY